MTENKIIGYFTLAAIIVSCWFTRVAMTWEDHPDLGFIDHFVDFHIDTDRIFHEAIAEGRQKEREKQDAADRERIIGEWVQDLNTWGMENSKWGMPDRDK